MTTLKDFDYEDIKVIGRGQYGKAHLVRNAKDQSLFIAKTIDLTCLSSKERESALQEVALLRRLDHPNIVEYKDNFFMGDTLVIIMQYCEGGDLQTYIKDMLKKRMRISEGQIMNYFVQVLQALQYIHHDRILHRDLKTSNLFLTKAKSVVKLGDFGISRVLEGSIEAAITVVGTPYYMSPEVCENKPYTFKSDVWSLGCVLYELCMLKHAFSADNLLGLVYKIVSDKYEPIPIIYSKALNTLIQRMLEKNADRRPSVRELLADPHVHASMNEYVRTRGQCATASGSGGSRPPGGGGTHRATGSGGTGSAHSGGLRAHNEGGASASAGGGERVPRSRPARPAGGRRSQQSSETPKEAALRRKREAADRQAAELRVAAKQSLHNKTVARQMKEAEFQTTRLGGGMAAAAAPAPCPVTPGGTTTGAFSAGSDGHDTRSATPEDDLESPQEEISESYSSAEEYPDDFEDDFCTEDEEIDEIGSDFGEAGTVRAQGGMLSTVREEEDFTRVMSNYEQDLRRAEGVASPLQRRPSNERTGSAVPRGTPVAVDGPPVGSAIMDMRTRAHRLKEELMHKMGAEIFQNAFAFLLDARARGADERAVKRDLEKLVGRETYKLYCFDVDQLVFQHMLYS